MSKNYDFDYIIIGSGPAGRTIASRLAEAHKKVAIVEAGPIGGAEINTHDLPYDIALDFAHTYQKFISFPCISDKSHFNFPTLLSGIDQKISKASEKLKSELEDKDIKIIKGFGHFLDSHTLAVGNQEITAHNFVLATGSKLKASEIAGLDSVKYLTPVTAFRIRRLPKFIFVVGGGPTGVQIADFFASLGVGVIIMERGSQLLPREDEEISSLITKHFTEKLGITIVTNAKVLQLTEDQASKIVVFTNGTGEKMVRVDSIAIATGSEPFLDYGLENAGVDYRRSGIIVDKYFNTSAKNIFAIGDCVGGPDSSTERACLEADTLAENLLHRGKTTAKYSNLSRYINTNPEIAVTGLNEHDALSRDLKYKKSITYLGSNQNNFIKTLTDHSGRLLGSTVVAPNANQALRIHKLLTK